MERIRLMTHNVWNHDNNDPRWEARGEDCSAQARVGGLLRIYEDTMPDIIGGQEFTYLMTDLVKEGLDKGQGHYTLIWGRFTPIYYRSDKFDLLDSEFGTYPEFMEGYEGKFNDVRSKCFNLGVFRVKESGKIFIFATTHLWWKKSPPDESYLAKHGYQIGSDEARQLQISIVSSKVNEYRQKYNCPAVIVGDMNAHYDAPAMADLRAQGYRHARFIATEYAEEAVGYHYCFPDRYETYYFDRPFEMALDHIYVIGEEEGSVKRFERYSPEYYLPISDHSPAYIDWEL